MCRERAACLKQDLNHVQPIFIGLMTKANHCTPGLPKKYQQKTEIDKRESIKKYSHDYKQYTCTKTACTCMYSNAQMHTCMLAYVHAGSCLYKSEIRGIQKSGRHAGGNIANIYVANIKANIYRENTAKESRDSWWN